MVDLKIKLPNGFLNEEVRDGYQITSKMKQVWAVELDLLTELLRVCEKNNIQIFASGGTMLGAVRHHGFIPWDDDIDMMMFRKDYEHLCQIAEKEFEYPYFFQTEYTDPGSLRGHAQLRNSLTTAILKSEMGKFQFNQGIFIDIFPLDSVTDNEDDYMKQEKLAKKYLSQSKRYARCSTRFHKETPSIKFYLKEAIHKFFYDFCRQKELDDYKKFEEICQIYNGIETEKISTLSFQFSNRQHFKYRADYKEFIEMPFEFLQIPVGKNYDHALKCRYGDDYLTPKQATSDHGSTIFDVDKPYTEIVNKTDKIS